MIHQGIYYKINLAKSPLGTEATLAKEKLRADLEGYSLTRHDCHECQLTTFGIFNLPEIPFGLTTQCQRCGASEDVRKVTFI